MVLCFAEYVSSALWKHSEAEGSKAIGRKSCKVLKGNVVPTNQ